MNKPSSRTSEETERLKAQHAKNVEEMLDNALIKEEPMDVQAEEISKLLETIYYEFTKQVLLCLPNNFRTVSALDKIEESLSAAKKSIRMQDRLMRQRIEKQEQMNGATVQDPTGDDSNHSS